MLSCYHVGGELTYDEYVGLVLNQPEVELRKAYIMALAIEFPSKDEVEPIWARAVTETKEQADEWLWEVNSSRYIAKKRAKL